MDASTPWLNECKRAARKHQDLQFDPKNERTMLILFVSDAS